MADQDRRKGLDKRQNRGQRKPRRGSGNRRRSRPPKWAWKRKEFLSFQELLDQLENSSPEGIKLREKLIDLYMRDKRVSLEEGMAKAREMVEAIPPDV